MLDPALLQIDEDVKECEARKRQPEEEVERAGVVVGRRSVNDSAGDEWANEGGCFADDAEKGEEEEFVAAGRYCFDVRTRRRRWREGADVNVPSLIMI